MCWRNNPEANNLFSRVFMKTAMLLTEVNRPKAESSFAVESFDIYKLLSLGTLN